jgi:hypothetical protein
MDFPHRTSPADGAKNAGPDPRDRKKAREPLAHAPFLGTDSETIRVRSRNFH